MLVGTPRRKTPRGRSRRVRSTCERCEARTGGRGSRARRADSYALPATWSRASTMRTVAPHCDASRSAIVLPAKPRADDQIVVGSFPTVRHVAEAFRYTARPEASEPSRGKGSRYETPIGRTLLGKQNRTHYRHHGSGRLVPRGIAARQRLSRGRDDAAHEHGSSRAYRAHRGSRRDRVGRPARPEFHDEDDRRDPAGRSLQPRGTVRSCPRRGRSPC